MARRAYLQTSTSTTTPGAGREGGHIRKPRPRPQKILDKPRRDETKQNKKTEPCVYNAVRGEGTEGAHIRKRRPRPQRQAQEGRADISANLDPDHIAARESKARRDNARQAETRQDKMRPKYKKTGPCVNHALRSEGREGRHIRQLRPRTYRHKAKRGKTRQDKTSEDKTRQGWSKKD